MGTVGEPRDYHVSRLTGDHAVLAGEFLDPGFDFGRLDRGVGHAVGHRINS